MEKKYTEEDIRLILEEVVLAHQMFLTKNGVAWEPDAERFIEWLGGYSKYCLPYRAQEWEEKIRELIYNPKVLKPWVQMTPELKKYLDDDKDTIIRALYHYMDAAEVMEVYANTHSWEEVKRTVDNLHLLGWGFGCLRDILLDYSLMGTEFVERFDPISLDRDKNRKKAYLERKAYLESAHKLIDVLNGEVQRRQKI